LIASKAYLFDFWKDIPVLSTITVEERDAINKSPIRNAIVKTFPLGIEDVHPISKKKQFRRGLTANEIFKQIKGSAFDEEIKLPNVYFHLKELEKLEMIKILTTIQRGQRFTTYYGRTSRMTFLKHEITGPEESKFAEDDLQKIIKQFAPEMNNADISEILQNLARIECDTMDYFASWVESQKDRLQDLKVDNKSLFRIYREVFRYNNEVHSSLSKLASILNIDRSKPLL